MLQISSTILNTIKTLPKSCVYALIDDASIVCSVLHSVNLKAQIGGILSGANINTKLVVLEVLDDLEYKLLFCEKYKQMYKDLGYSIGNPRQYINYKVSIRYSERYQSVQVVLVNKRGSKKVVGEFSSVQEAGEFVEEYYSGQGVIFPVYSVRGFHGEMLKPKQ